MKIKFIEKASEKMEASKLTFSNLLTEKELSETKGGLIANDSDCFLYLDHCVESFLSTCLINHNVDFDFDTLIS